LRRAFTPKPTRCPPAPRGFTKSSTTDFRIISRKDGRRFRLYSQPGNDFTRRFPLIVEALANLRWRSCKIDGLRRQRRGVSFSATVATTVSSSNSLTRRTAMTHLRQSSDLAPKEGREFMRRGTGFRGSKRLNRAQEKREIRRALLLGRQIGK